MIFRFSTPLCISIADYIFLGRHLPSARSWLCLVMLLLGAMGYALTDAAYVVRGYMFCGLWYFIFCMDQIYLKHVADTVKMESNWGRVLYSNLLSCLPLLVLSGASGEEAAVMEASLAGVLMIMVTVVL